MTANAILPGSTHQERCGLVTSSAEGAWRFANWLTHARAILVSDAEATIGSTELPLSSFTTVLIRYVRGLPHCRPPYGSQRLAPERGVHQSDAGDTVLPPPRSIVEVRTLIFSQAVRPSSMSASSWSEQRRSFASGKNRPCDGVGSCLALGRWSVLVIARITDESPYSQAPKKPGKPFPGLFMPACFSPTLRSPMPAPLAQTLPFIMASTASVTPRRHR